MTTQANRFPKGCDPRFAHVTFDYAGRHYLGMVRDYYRDDVTGTVRLKVYHMNGEPWADPYYPDRTLDPPMCNVEVLVRDFDWTCPRCGAILGAEHKHCPCEAEGGKS